MRRLSALLARIAAGFLVIGTLTGSLVVSCAGDSGSSTGGGGGGSNAPSSQSMGRWTPATQDTCTKAFHDTFFVVGPDGKKYPTWHPPEKTDPATNQLCTFGHEHGRDPSGSAMWQAIKSHFAFDANSNGVIDASERDASGVPFGYVSEQLVSSNTPRIEDHTGYKIAFSDGVPRTATSSPTQFNGVTCDLFAAYNQPTATGDAFASNLFSVIYGVNCNSGASQSAYPVDAIVSVMATYRNPGFFTLADGTEFDVPQAPVPGTSPAGGSELGRVVPESGQVFSVFVPNGSTTVWTPLNDRWETQLRLTLPNGNALATFAPVFRVSDPARFYHAASQDGLGRSIDLCYWGLNGAGGLVTDAASAPTIVRQVRDGSNRCALVAPNGPSTGAGQRLKFDDKTSPFRGCVRTATFGTESVTNANGSVIWYTTAFGAQASPTRFANSVVQRVGIANTAQIVLAQSSAGGSLDCATSVHAPN